MSVLRWSSWNEPSLRAQLEEDPAAAIEASRPILDAARADGDHRTVSAVLAVVGRARLVLGELELAELTLLDALRAARSADDQQSDEPSAGGDLRGAVQRLCHALQREAVDGLGSAAGFATRLLEEAGVVCSPGTGFGPGGEGYVRFSYANSVENIEEAVKRIGKLLVEG